jgi:hypothetical protein
MAALDENVSNVLNENSVSSEPLPHQRSTYNLFDDQKLKLMFENMPEAEKRKYKESGEHMYSYDYVNKGNPDDTIHEAVAYIVQGLKSGLRPSQLDESEKTHLRSVYGSKWYEKYGYSSEAD